MISREVQIPCAHCGANEKYHEDRQQSKRRNDKEPKYGYTTSLVLCPGFKAEERRNAPIDVFIGEQIERRISMGKSFSPSGLRDYIDSLPVPTGQISVTRPSDNTMGQLLRKRDLQ